MDYKDAISFLNELLGLDPAALESLIDLRVPCNKELGEHPTVQTTLDNSIYKVGLLGILNGLFGTDADGWGHITAVYDDNEKLIKFEETKGSYNRG